MILLLILISSLVITVTYLGAFEVLLARLRLKSPGYWATIGSPIGQSATATTAVLRHLYSQRMTQELAAHSKTVLALVRVTLPVGLAFNVLLVWAITRAY